MNTKHNSMVRLWRQGYSIEEIAAEFSTTDFTVMRVLASKGIKYTENKTSKEEEAPQ